jgi:hypothetical protein
MLFWDPGDFTTYRKVRHGGNFAWREFIDDVLGDMGECTIYQNRRSGNTHLVGLMQPLPISE